MTFLDCIVASRFATLAGKAPRNDGSDMAALNGLDNPKGRLGPDPDTANF